MGYIKVYSWMFISNTLLCPFYRFKSPAFNDKRDFCVYYGEAGLSKVNLLDIVEMK